MPWSVGDVAKHNKSVSDKSKDRWARIANAILARTNDEGLAIRTANARVKPSSDSIRRRLTRG